MKKSEFLKEYGIIVDYPEKALLMLGKEQILETKEKEEKYLCEDVRFSDATIQKENGVKYLAIEFLFNNFTDEPFWSPPFPTEIVAPEISEEYTKMMTEDVMGLISDNKNN